jgi:hypothetical protein
MIELDVLDDGADNQRVPTQLWDKVWVVAAIEGDGNLRSLQVLEGVRPYCHDLPDGKLLLLPRLIRVRATVNVVDLLVSLGEVALRILGHLVLLGLSSRLENFIDKPLQLVAVLSLMLSLWMENTDSVQESFKLTWPGPVFFITTWPLYVSNGAVQLPLLVVAFGGARPIQLTLLFVLPGACWDPCC